MKDFFAFLIGFLILSQEIIGQTINPYRADLIPEELKKEGVAVIRTEELTIDVKDVSKVITSGKRATTILNQSGSDHALFTISYDPSIEIKSLKAVLYNAAGIVVNKISSDNFPDKAIVDGVSLFNDNRFKYYLPAYENYPYTIEYSYETVSKNSFFINNWVVSNEEGVAVERSSFRLITKEELPLRFKEQHYPGTRKEYKDGKKQVYEWEVANVKPLKTEPFSPIEDNSTRVQVAPVHFQYEGINGSFSSWKEYGNWMQENLLKNRDLVPHQVEVEIKDLVKNAATDEEKVKIIYEYVQRKTRYVSIQKGIGGLQPMKAVEVDHYGYGDCKGLSNYTLALLKAAGIRSLYTEIYAGDEGKSVNADFPCVEGNHAILCVPLKDTIWLECTSNTYPAGYIGDFTDDRNAIVCTPEGAAVVRTKAYPAAGNKITTEGAFNLTATGTLQGTVKRNLQGIFYGEREAVVQLSGDKKMSQVKEIYHVSDQDIKNYNIVQERTADPVTKETLEVLIPGYASNKSDRLVLKLQPFPEQQAVPENLTSRINPVYIRHGFHKESTFEFTLPDQYTVDFVPTSRQVKNELGSFNFSVKQEGNKLKVVHSFVLNQGTFPPATYQQLIKLMKEVAYSDVQKVVLVKK